MSLQELRAFVEPLSPQEKQMLKNLLQDELPSSASGDWLEEHEKAVAAVVQNHPQAELPTDLSQTWKQTRRQQAQDSR